MGDYESVNSTLSPMSDDPHSMPQAPSVFPVSPQVLARWAAIACERACLGVIPGQVEPRV